MSKNLAKILDQPERLVTKTIEKLEDHNGYHSEDARLLAENSQAVRAKISELGLDPDDTTGEELYQALLARLDRDNGLIDRAVGLNSNSPLEQRLDKAIQLAGHMAQAGQTWFLKNSSAKNLLRQQPPRKLMKQLNYRSIESLLKREDINSIFLSLSYVESSSWGKTFAQKVAKLSGTDYESRQPQFAKIAPGILSDSKTVESQVISNELIGAVALKPSPKIQKAGVLSLALLLMDGLEQLTHARNSASTASLNPALLWWDQAKSLMAICGEDVVSLNMKDTAKNHLEQATYQERCAHHGRQSLWNELASRYKNQAARLQESLTDLETNAGQEYNKLTAKTAPKNPAVEYAEAIANEF